MGCKNSKDVSKPTEEGKPTTDEEKAPGSGIFIEGREDILNSKSSADSRYVSNGGIPDMPSTSPIYKGNRKYGNAQKL